MVNKPLYENVGIGTIIKRIGECTALTGDYNLFTLLTQQTPREDECKDMCITVGSKIVVIDFKAPDQITSSERVYLNVRTRINSLKSTLGLKNLLLGLLHATLRVTPHAGQKNGYFLHIATPMTTIFVPLLQFVKDKQYSSNTLNLGNIKIKDFEYSCFACEGILYNIMSSEKDLIFRASIPSCYNPEYTLPSNFAKICQHYSILHEACLPACIEAACPNSCFSCGGLCDVILKGNIGSYFSNSYLIKGYTLASLLWMMRCCKLGYYIKTEGDRDEILEYLGKWIQEGENKYTYILNYKPGMGFQVIHLKGNQVVD